jgi:hypothetical protein
MTKDSRLVALETSPPAFTRDAAEMMAWDIFGVAGKLSFRQQRQRSERRSLAYR